MSPCLLATVAGLAGLLPPDLELTDVRHSSGETIRHGRLEVFEDRAAGEGRTLHLDVVVLPARGSDPRPDPIFFLAGGPGQAATVFVDYLIDSPYREGRDLVLMDQRGTGGEHRLDLELASDGGNVQAFLDPLFDSERVRRDVVRLSKRADLRLYSTPLAMDDLDDLRAALGYETINLVGGSYGTRAALVYMRRHTDRVRTAILTGVAPLAMKNPLTHARQAQLALDQLFSECADLYPELPEQFQELMERLQREPAKVSVPHPATGAATSLIYNDRAFAEALRVTMYSARGSRQMPLLLQRAHGGDLSTFAAQSLTRGIGLRRSLALGMLLCVTCSEDVARITEDEIDPACDGTYLGDHRVRLQREVCALWPRSDLPEDFGEPVSVATPTLILVGDLDPVTGPTLGEQAARNLSNSLMVVYPGGHSPPPSPCLDEVRRTFLHAGTVEGLDISCVSAMDPGPFAVAEH